MIRSSTLKSVVRFAGRTSLACLVFSCAAPISAQTKPPIPVPSKEDPRRPEATNGPPKKVLGTEPRKQPDSENVPPVKIGTVLETTADGVQVRTVAPSSAAADAGLRQGDLIIRIAGKQF